MKHVLDKLAVFVATGFGSGYAAKAPGTVGSLVAIPLIGLVKHADVSHLSQICIFIFLCIIGLWSTARTESVWKTHDDGRIVIDEIAGMFITLMWFPFSAQNVVVGFALFRLFDIWKPGPIGYIDENAPGAWGTFFDDIVAGAFAAAFLWLISTNFF
jgi:phosphatidylglycerophosphatase A